MLARTAALAGTAAAADALATAQPLGAGADADAYLLELPGAAPGDPPHPPSHPPLAASSAARATGRWVLRIPRHPAAAARLAVEPPLLAVLAAAGVPQLPRQAQALRDPSADGAGALLGVIHRYAAGDPPPRHLRGGARTRLAAEVAAFLSALHRVPPRAARSAGLREVPLWPREYEPLLARLDDPARRVHPATRARLHRAARALAHEWSGRPDPPPGRVVHGDLQRGHLLIDDRGGLSAVLDWSYAMIADPALDFAGAGYALGWGFAEAVLAAYLPPPGVRVDAGFRARARAYLALADLYRIAYP